MTATEDTGRCIRGLPIERYAADDVGAPQPCLNSSAAHRILTRSPHHVWWYHPRLGGHQTEPNERMDIGSAAHAMLLEARDVIVPLPYDDWRTAAAREARDAVRAEGRIPLLLHQADAVTAMVLQAQLALDRSPDLAGLGDLDTELTYVWREIRVGMDGTECEVWLKARPDAVTRDRRVVLSYKTTSGNAEPEAYTRAIVNAGYELQAAFELAAVEAVDGVRPSHYVWLVQETDPPYACSLIGLSEQMRHLGLMRLDAAALRWGQCIASGEWPGYPDRVAYVDPPAWLMSDAEARYGE